MKKIVGIIPARGGSKRLKGKNLMEIEGIPLLKYTIDAALSWGKFDSVFVNSDDERILDAGIKFGAEKYVRPESFGADKAKVLDVVKEQIEKCSFDNETDIILLLPTCPLRSWEDIKMAYGKYVDNGRRFAVVSVTEYEKSPDQALKIDNEGKLSPMFPERYSSRSQDHGPAYRYNTGIVINSAANFMKQKDIVGEKSIPYIMPFIKSIDIDYDYHVQMIRSLLRDKLGGEKL